MRSGKSSTSVLEPVLRRRLATQRISAEPFASTASAVRSLVAVQAQDPPLAAWSLGLRTESTTYADVLAGQATGSFVRTHVLRPTWHFVAREDLRWLQRLTGSKVMSGLAARHRQLDLDEATVRRALDAVIELLGDGPMTRAEIGPQLAAGGLVATGPQTGHVLMLGELRTLLCSGPPRGVQHTYALVDHTIPPGPLDDLEREDAVQLLVERFFAGHGPATDRDLNRWCGLPLTEIRRAAATAHEAGRLDRLPVDGDDLWFDPTPPPAATRPPGALLLPTFDELFLTYPRHNFPRRGLEDERADRARLWAEAAGGVVIVGLEDIGTFKRTVTKEAVRIAVTPDARLTSSDVDEIAAAADRLAAFIGLPADLQVVS